MECVARYKTDDTAAWYRAVITDLYPNTREAYLFFVDYGNSEIIRFSNLRRFSDQSRFLSILPHQVSFVSCDNVAPKCAILLSASALRCSSISDDF